MGPALPQAVNRKAAMMAAVGLRAAAGRLHRACAAGDVAAAVVVHWQAWHDLVDIGLGLGDFIPEELARFALDGTGELAWFFDNRRLEILAHIDRLVAIGIEKLCAEPVSVEPAGQG